MDWDEFRNLDLAEIGQWPRPAKLLVWGLMVILLVFASHQLLLSEQLRKLNLAEREERSLKLKYEEQYRTAARLAAQQRNRPASAALPESADTVAALLEQISRAGANNGVEFLLFQPEPQVQNANYTELPIRIRVAGSYHSFGHFISELARLPRAISLQELRISKSNRKGQPLLVMELVIKRYEMPGGAG